MPDDEDKKVPDDEAVEQPDEQHHTGRGVKPVSWEVPEIVVGDPVPD
jgi:hypothetical protein